MASIYNCLNVLNGRRGLNLASNKPRKGCLTLGPIVHEFFYAVGFYHHQSDSNRDDYVRIVKENIHPSSLFILGF